VTCTAVQVQLVVSDSDVESVMCTAGPAGGV